MKSKLKIIVALVASAFVISNFAAADSIKLTGVGGNNQGGVYTVPYYLSVNGGPKIIAMCDDYTHDVVIGESWQAHIFKYSDLGINLTLTRAGASVADGGLGLDLATAQQDYRELFWLLSQFNANPAIANSINFAAWAIFDSDVKNQAGWTNGPNSAAYWLGQAQLSSNYGTVNASNFLIISPYHLQDGTGTFPLQSGSPQEFVTQVPVPEPASLLLLASGLFGAYSRRKILRQ